MKVTTAMRYDFFSDAISHQAGEIVLANVKETTDSLELCY